MYHFLTERYPQIVDEVSTQAILPFCDVYLHLNGYIETCVNRSKKYPHVSFDESLFLDLIQHIEHVLHILRPQKNLFLFLDGVIPCALHPNLLATRFLNEQSRLGKLEYVYFSETKKKKKQRYKIKKETSDEDQLKHDSDSSLYTCFDSYNTLAGTPFMNKLEDFLIHYITSKLEFDLTWKNLNVIFSGSKIPGEGRHKILSFLRQLSTLKDSPAVRRCVYTHQENSFLTCLMAPIQNLFLLKNIVTKDQCIENQKINFNTFYGRESYSLIPIHLLRECLFLDIVSVKTLQAHSCASLVHKSCCQPKDLSKEKTINSAQLSESLHVLSNMSAAMGYNGACSVNDFVFLCILCNHHISLRLPFVDMQEMPFHQVLSMYNSYICMFSKEAEEKCLIDRHGTIQWQNLLQFLKLCEKETNREQCKEGLKDFNTFNKTKYNPSKSVSYVSHSLNEAEQFLSLMQKKEANVLGFADVTALPIFNTVNRNVHTFPTLREYEIFYYSWYFGWNLLNESDARKIYHVVLNYCKALQWTFSYYYSGVTDWYWSYPYRYPPLFSSLLKVVPALSKLPLTLTPNVYSCSSQLLALLPYTSANILPETYQKFFLSERLTKFYNVNNLLSVMKNVHFTLTYFKNFQAFLQKNAHLCTSTPQTASPIALLFKKNLEKITLQPSLMMTEWEHSLVDEVCKKVKNLTANIINDNFKHWYQSQSIKDDLHYPFPMLSYLDIYQVSLESINNETCGNQNVQGMQLHLYIHCWEPFKQTPQHHSQHMEDACFQLLYEHFHDKTLFFDYPHQNAGKLVGIFGKNWFFRRRNFNDLNENEMHCDLDISQLQMYSNSVAVEKSSKKNSFLYIASAHCPKTYNQILETFHSESHKLGLHYDFSSCPMTSDMMKKILEKALHAGHKKKFRESYASLSYSPQDIFIEILPLSDLMISQTKIKYNVKAQTIYRPFCLLYQKYSQKFSTNTKRKTQKVPLLPGSHVICVNSSNPLFGCTGIMKCIGDSSSATEAIIHVYQESYDERWTMQKEMYDISASDLRRTEWYYIEEMSQMLDIPSHVLQALTQFLWIETNSHVSLDIGLNLVSFEENNIFCVPSYTSFIPDYKDGSLGTDMKPLFSKTCIDLLRKLATTYHSLVDALIKYSRVHDKIVTSRSQPIKISSLFPHKSFEKTLSSFIAWRKQQPVFHMCRATPSTQSLSLEGIKRVEAYQKQWFQKRRKCFKLCVKDSNEIYPIEQGMLPDVLLAASPLKYFLKKDFSYLGRLLVGQRVVYAKLDGLLPFGAFGCVSATTIGPDGLEQWVELITEQRHLSCTDLANRCSPFRGIRVPTSSLISIVPVILPWGLSIASLSNYQALIQESVQQLQLYHQSHALNVWHSDSPIMRQLISQMKTITINHETQPVNKQSTDSVNESKRVSQNFQIRDFCNKEIHNMDEKSKKDDKQLSTVERLLQYKIKLHQNKDPPAQVELPTHETPESTNHTEYPCENVNQKNECSILREDYLNKTQQNCQKDLAQLLKSFTEQRNTQNLAPSTQDSNSHSLCFANIQSNKASECHTKINKPQFQKVGLTSISPHKHFDNFSRSGHELLTLLQQPPKSCVFVSQIEKKKSTPTSEVYISHHRKYSNKDKFSSMRSDNVPFLFTKHRGRKCLPPEMSHAANQRCYSKSDQHLIRILKHTTVNNPVAPACIPTFHPRQSH